MASSQGGPEGQPSRRHGQGPGIVVARPFGIPVHVSPSWFVVAGVVIIVRARFLDGTLGGSARYLASTAFVVLLYLSVLVHELSHSVVARGFGLPVRRILLYPLGGVSEIEREPQTPGRELLVSAAGPLLSLVLGFASLWLARAVGGGIPWIVLRQLMYANFFVAVFNFLPGLPLDGGRMLRAVIWKVTGRPGTATIAAAWVGRGLAVAMLAYVPWRLRSATVADMTYTMIWVAAIAAFIWAGAGQSIRATRFRARLPDLQARRLARKAVSVSASTPLAEAIRQADESRARAVVVVDHDSKPIAILNEAAVMATPPQRRPWIEAGTLARSIQPDLVLPADLSGMALLDAVRRAPAGEYLLVEPSGQVYGVLAARDLDVHFSGI